MNGFIRIVKSMAIAFSMYSRIPMPQFEWKKEDMRWMLCFFPLVGAVIGILTWLWWVFCSHFRIGNVCFSCVGIAIPLLISGGIHLDGYMDTMDALRSYKSREKKLEILKDPHVGAFAVIMTAVCLLIAAGAYSQINTSSVMASFCGSFFLSRVLSAAAVVSFPCAKREGTLYLFAGNAHKRAVKVILMLEIFAAAVYLTFMDPWAGFLEILFGYGIFLRYYFQSKKEFGGITGDLAGYFVTECECAMIVAAAIACL